MKRDQIITDLECPNCGGECPDPFIRGQVHTYVHKRGSGHPACRFIVDVDPIGDDHRFVVLEPKQRFEDVLPSLLESPDRAKRELRTTFLRQSERIEKEAS